MNLQRMILLHEKAVLLYRRAAGIPVKARLIFGLFLVAAVLMAIHTAFTAKDVAYT
jgi:hypothetical protein